MAILEVNDLKQYFYINPGMLAKMVSKKKPSVIKAVDGLTFSLEPGEILGVAGESGCGKSTLLNILGLLDRPNNGTYELDDIMTTSLDDKKQADVRRHKIGFVFQFHHLLPEFTALKYTDFDPVLLEMKDFLKN